MTTPPYGQGGDGMVKGLARFGMTAGAMTVRPSMLTRAPPVLEGGYSPMTGAILPRHPPQNNAAHNARFPGGYGSANRLSCSQCRRPPAVIWTSTPTDPDAD